MIIWSMGKCRAKEKAAAVRLILSRREKISHKRIRRKMRKGPKCGRSAILQSAKATVLQICNCQGLDFGVLMQYNHIDDILSAIERRTRMQHKDPQLMEKIRDFALSYYKENNRMPTVRAIADGVGSNRGSVQKYLVEMAQKGMIDYDGRITRINSVRAATDNKETYNAGILGSIACGIPDDVEEHVEEYVPLPVSIFGRGELYILRANGDSMINAGIDDGDLIVVRITTEAKDGDIVVALT